MKALVTGSNGFIGSHLVDSLLRNNFEVACLFRKGSNSRFLDKLDIQRIYIDFNDIDSLLAIDALQEADYIFHLAGVTKHTNLDDFNRGNLTPTHNLLQAAAKRCDNLKQFIFLSSQAAAGPALSLEQPMVEADPASPIEFYGESKKRAEDVVLEYKNHFPVTIIRPGAVYGPRDVDFLNLFKQIKTGLNLYPQNRKKYVSIIYVDDLVAGIISCAGQPSAYGEIFNLCNEDPVTWETIQESMVAIMDKKVLHATIPSFAIFIAGKAGDLIARFSSRVPVVNTQKIKLSQPVFWVMSPEKAIKLLSFSPKTTLQDGLRKTLSWYRESGWLK